MTISIPGGTIRPPDKSLEEILEQLSNTDADEVTKVAASQLEIMNSYHYLVQKQAERSFFWALVAAGVGLVFFIIALSLALFTQIEHVAIISVSSGAIVEVLSAINFYLYEKTSSQLTKFYAHLDITQRFILANSVCEGLEGKVKQQTRAELVLAISDIDPSVIS